MEKDSEDRTNLTRKQLADLNIQRVLLVKWLSIGLAVAAAFMVIAISGVVYYKTYMHPEAVDRPIIHIQHDIKLTPKADANSPEDSAVTQ